MFSVTWMPVNTNNLGPDLGPGQCEVDIVGNSTFPALYSSVENNFVYFRMRLNCNPIKNGKLQNRVWGFVIKDTGGNPIYTVRVNGSGNTDKVQVYTADDTDPFIALQCEQDIVFGGNVVVNLADSNFDSNPDYFLDFKVPRNSTCFPIDPFDDDLIYCGFTSENPNNINKEVPPPYESGGANNPNLCGESEPPPVMKVKITKTVTPLTANACISQVFNVRIKVKNVSGDVLTGLLITDVINSQFVVVNPPGQYIFTDGPFDLPDGHTRVFKFNVEGYFTKVGSFPFNTITVTQDKTVLGTFTGPDITVSIGPCRGISFL